MPRKPTGSVYSEGGRFSVRITLGPNIRRSVPLREGMTREQADARGALVADLAARLRAASLPTDTTLGVLGRAGAAREGRDLDTVRGWVDRICRGELVPKPSAPTAAATVMDLGRRWTSGELARAYPDHVRLLVDVSTVRSRLEQYVYPIAGDVALPDFRIEHAIAVMQSLPPRLAPGTRRVIGRLLHRVLALAVWPLRLIPAHPLPRNFVPKRGAEKAKQYLYPDEDAKLLGCTAVPLCWRVLYGFLHREGPRISEAEGFTVADVDLERGAVTLDVNKTKSPRSWALSPDVVQALRAWLVLRGNPGPEAPLFVGESGKALADHNVATRFRSNLRKAGVDRETLYQRDEVRQPIRIHDTRATFITLKLATGKTETWIADRTGHASSTMINVYRRQARQAAELGLGDLGPMHSLVPELRAALPSGEAPPGDNGRGNGRTTTRRRAKPSKQRITCSGGPFAVNGPPIHLTAA